jgi:hypothetical protein
MGLQSQQGKGLKMRRWFMGVLALGLLPFANRADETGPGHWAFQPPRRPAIPAVHDASRMRTPVDAFLLARLEAGHLDYSPEADRTTLLRRAYLDLWGIPPTIEEVDAFLADKRADAFGRVLDSLLASPRFGERWARHWLDLAGYADTVGFDIDATLIIQSEGKWRYRDYVIAALNDDLPYDQFVREQIAGDEMVDWRHARVFTAEIRKKLIATGFLRNARDESHEPESNIPLIFYGVLHNTLDITCNSLLGLTMQCARCHDHKFDPISQKEYYQLMAFFTPAYNPRDWRPVYPWKAGIKDRGLPDVSSAELKEIERHNRALDDRVARCLKELADLRRPYEDRLRQAKLKAIPEAIREDTRAALVTPSDKRSEVQRYLAAKFKDVLRVPPEEVDKALTAIDKTAIARLNEQVAAIKKKRRSFGKIQALVDVGPPPPTYFLKRGNHERKGAEVQPAFLSTLGDVKRQQPVAVNVAGSSGRRLALANWLTEPNSRASALLARVLVNRLWQHLFGVGLVPTPENFGLSGQRPTHPELLEWLSQEFARRGWRIKPMLKLMMMSSAYRQSSRPAGPKTTAAEKVDPGNKLLWKMRLRRLEAEAIRDSMLAVSGRLHSTMGGPPVRIKWQPDGMVVLDKKSLANPSAGDRRSIYLLFRRAYNLSFLSVFDQPLVAINCTRRDASAVPLQALAMLNDDFVIEQAGHVADRVTRLLDERRVRSVRPKTATPFTIGDKLARTERTLQQDRIRLAFQLALARLPNDKEVDICKRLLQRQTAIFRASKLSPHAAAHQALVQLCHTILNTSEFLYVE